MMEMSKRVWATVDLGAFKKNLALVSKLCPNSKIFPVVKSNAYGHGMEKIATAVSGSSQKVAGLAVATIQEAAELHKLKLGHPILPMNGFVTKDELCLSMELNLDVVLHAYYQVELVQELIREKPLDKKTRFWVKMNTGMNRLGMFPEECQTAIAFLKSVANAEVVFMTHLACADDMENSESKSFTNKQLKRFRQTEDEFKLELAEKLQTSISASAGILTLTDAHRDYVRPGIMLYGSSPLVKKNGEDLGLHPVMTLSSRLIAIKEVQAGEGIGYGATYVCKKETKVGTVSIGYGDGYPRSARNGTPVLIKTSKKIFRTQIIGRVSMDMITVDLSGIDDVQINDEVVLWGRGLVADEVAAYAGTIAYELFCKVTRRVPFIYV